LRGKGVDGQTKFNSTTATNGQAGVLGEDLSTSGVSNWGVRGTSSRGRGVQGTSISNVGVWGNSTSANGVRGASTSANGVFGQTFGSSAFGVMGSTSVGKAAVNGTVSSPSVVGVSGIANTEGTAIMGVANNEVEGQAAVAGVGHGIDPGLFGTSDRYMGIIGETDSAGDAGVDAETSASGGVALLANSRNGTGAILRTYRASTPALLLQNASSGGAGNPIMIASNLSNDVMSLDEAGNLIVSGSITSRGTPLVVRQSPFGQTVASYAASTTSPVIEDFGHARLTYGAAYVSIDRTFAATIDPRILYMVFLTPNADSRGLYVAGKSLNGFSVHENFGGRSSIGFDYRIVARPNGEKPLRLPSVAGPMITASTPRTQQLQAMLRREDERFARLQKQITASRAQALQLVSASRAALAHAQAELAHHP
jgi:hypothetical protein